MANTIKSILAGSLIIGAVISHAADSTILPSSVLLTAFGQNSIDYLPILIQSNDDGATWSTATINNAEADMLFNSSNCTRPGSNNLCIATGYNANIDAPLLVQSTDNGLSWSVIATPALPVNGALNSSHCTGSDSNSICIAAGTDHTTGVPVLIQTIDNGLSWTSAPIAGMSANGSFNKASCTDSGVNVFCIAVGYDYVNRDALLVQTDNRGTSWSVVTIPGATANTTFTSASCTGAGPSTFCIAAGYNNMTATPVIVQSSDRGINWTSTSITGLASHAIFYGTSCINSTDTVCIAVGQNLSTSEPVIAETHDRGANWQLAIINSISTSGLFYNASCSTNGASVFCTAVGDDYSGNLPLLLVQSTDNGQTWGLAPVSENSAGSLGGTYCTDNGSNAVCIAAGFNSITNEPLLIQTNDSGLSWSQQTVTDLPEAGVLTGAIS